MESNLTGINYFQRLIVQVVISAVSQWHITIILKIFQICNLLFCFSCRSLHRGQVSSLSPPQLGWNVPVTDQAFSPWGQRNVSPCFNQANPFQDNFVPAAITTSASPSPASYDRLSATNSLWPTALSQANSSVRETEPRPSSTSKGSASADSASLITLSPVNTLQPNKDSKNQHSTYSMDLEGLDFTAVAAPPTSSTTDSKPVNSSTEELSSADKPKYPDYSHVFNEIRNKGNVNNMPQLKPSYPQAHTGAFGFNYGWNMSYLSGNQQSVTTTSKQSNYQSTFRSNWTYQSPRPAYNVWGYDQRFIMPTFTTTGQGASLTQVASSSDFDSLRKPKETLVLDEESEEVFSGDLTAQEEEKQPRSRTSSDLMDFEGPEEKEYMSLDSFDPLYSRTRRESILFRRNSVSEEEERTERTANSHDFSDLERPKSGFYPSIKSETKDSGTGVAERVSTDSESMSSADALELFLRSSHVEEETKPDIPERPPPPKRRASGSEVRGKKLKILYIDSFT